MANQVSNSGALSIQRVLKETQAWKYKSMMRYLDIIGEPYEFEYMIPHTHYIYDLYLPNYRLLIEFDGESHNNKVDKVRDAEKESVAYEHFYDVIRVPVKSNSMISVECIIKILEQYKITG